MNSPADVLKDRNRLLGETLDCKKERRQESVACILGAGKARVPKEAVFVQPSCSEAQSTLITMKCSA